MSRTPIHRARPTASTSTVSLLARFALQTGHSLASSLFGALRQSLLPPRPPTDSIQLQNLLLLCYFSPIFHPDDAYFLLVIPQLKLAPANSISTRAKLKHLRLKPLLASQSTSWPKAARRRRASSKLANKLQTHAKASRAKTSARYLNGTRARRVTNQLNG